MWIVANELYHHGIKGQKWGERNYQNQDGSLTAAGEARYLVGGDSAYGGTTRGAITSKTPKSAISKIKPESKVVKNPARSKKKQNTNSEEKQVKKVKKTKDNKRTKRLIRTAVGVTVVAAAAVGTKMAVRSAAAKKGARIMEDLKAEGLITKVTNDKNSAFANAWNISKSSMDEYKKRMGRLGQINSLIN